MKKINAILPFLLMFFTLSSNAQKFEWLTGGGSKYDQYISDFTVDKAGNIYAVGFVNDSLIIQDKALDYSWGIFLAKFSPKGKILYLKPFGSGLSTKAADIEYDTSGYLYITGNYTNSKITFGNVTISNPVSNAVRPFIVKTDLSGDGVWGVNINSGNSASVNVMKHHVKDSLIVVGGRYWGNTELYFGNKDTFRTRGSYDCYLAAYSSNTGAFKWVELGGTEQWDALSNMDIDDDGNTYVTITYQMINNVDSFKSQQLTIPCTHGYDGTLVKFNKNGKVVWNKVISGRRGQTFSAVKVGKDNALYASCGMSDLDTANFFGQRFKPPNNYSLNLLKLDTSGNVLIRKGVYISYLGHLIDMQTDANGDLYLLGQNSFKLDTIQVYSNNKSNFFIVKADTSLTALKAVSGGNSNLHPLYNMFVKPNGDVILGGATELPNNSVFSIRTKSFVTRGDLDVFLTKWNFDDTCVDPVANMKISPKQNSYELSNLSKGDVDFVEWIIDDSIRVGDLINHSFAKPGVYNVKLVAVNQCGTDTIKDKIYHKCIPTAKFDFEVKGRTVEFTNKSINAVKFEWDFGQGVIDSIANTRSYYGNKGVYPVRLITKGVCGVDTIVHDVTINCDLPQAKFELLDTHYSVLLKNKSVGAQTYKWDFGDGTTSLAFEPIKTYPAINKFKISLEVKNNCGLDTFEVSVDINCPKPLINIDLIRSEDTVWFRGISTNFRLENWKFAFGDGQFENNRVVEHVYPERKKYEVTLTAENVCGKDTANKEVDLSCLPPDVDFNFVVKKDSVDFKSVVISDYPTDIHFDLGDGNASQNTNFQHIYADLDVFKVMLTGSSVCGNDTVIKEVDLRCKPIADFEVEVLDYELSLTNKTVDSDSFTWNVGGIFKSNMSNPVVTHKDTGWVNIQMIAVNDCGQDTAERTVYVSCPTMRIRLDHTVTGTVVDFAVHDSSNTALAWEWDFGDGEKDTSRVHSHDYKRSGDYNLNIKCLNECSEVILEQLVVIEKTNRVENEYDNLTIEFDRIHGWVKVKYGKDPVELKLFSIDGRLLSVGEQKVKTVGFSPGIYVLRILVSNGRRFDKKVWISE